MYSSSVKKPAVIASMKRLHVEYTLLKKRRLTLEEELRDNSEESRSLELLRRDELKTLSSHIAKIERFLQRYGFIEGKGADYDDIIRNETHRKNTPRAATGRHFFPGVASIYR